MTEKECRDWLDAAGRRLGKDAGPLRRLLDAWAPAHPDARWEVSIDSVPGLSTLGLRCFAPGAPKLPAAWAVFDLKAGRRAGGGEDGLRWQDASAAALAPFKDFAALHPVSGIVAEAGAWSLRLRRPAPWPDFCATSLIKPFADQGGLAAGLAGGLAVREVRFDEAGGARLWLSAP